MNLSKTKKEIARDIVALGSPVFFLLVVARISLLSNYEYLSQFVIAGILFFSLAFILFDANLYSGLGIIVLIFTAKYYGDLKFAIFAAALYFLLVASLVFLKEEKNRVVKGLLLGLLSTAISYYAASLIFG